MCHHSAEGRVEPHQSRPEAQYPLRVDTVVLAEAFQFPACNYDQNDIKVTVKLQCSILARETSRYAREMYLDCIYLRPRK